MKFYNFISTIVLPLTVIHFACDYLSDSYITHSETEIGILQMTHHFLVVFNLTGIFVLPFFDIDLVTLFVSIMTLVIIQFGYLKNKEFCWLTRLINEKIKPGRKDRKWMGDFFCFMKHYVRGSDWTHGDIYKVDNRSKVLITNVVFLFILIKFILKNNII